VALNLLVGFDQNVHALTANVLHLLAANWNLHKPLHVCFL